MNKDNFKIRDKRNKGWFYLDNEYLNGFGKKFGPIGIAIYVCLCRHANNHQQAFPSHKTIAEELGITEKTVKKYLKIMKDHNIFAVEQRRNKDGKFLHNVYTLMDKSVWEYPKGTKLPTVREGTKFHHRRVIDSTTVGNDVPPKDTNIRNTNKKVRLKKSTTSKRKSIKFPKEDYDLVLKEYQRLKKITLQGKEFDPVMQEIKTMFISNRTPEDIIAFMEWLAEKAENEKKKWDWTRGWTIKTIRLKLPEFLANTLEKEEDIVIPEYAKKWQGNKNY